MAPPETIGIALVGCGTVGRAVVRLLVRDNELLTRRVHEEAPFARQLLAERDDMDDIVRAIEKIHEHRLDFSLAAGHKKE